MDVFFHGKSYEKLEMVGLFHGKFYKKLEMDGFFHGKSYEIGNGWFIS